MARRQKRFTVEAGRQIYLDGEPFIGVTREGNTGPATADEFTRLIADLLNRSAKAKRIVGGGRTRWQQEKGYY